ncbi:MAG: ABC transporter ATP-binding protein [Anaerolineales bacterium]|nr:ABC transporter ATP-binding protein [Anaerolineales bacterium]
MTTATAAAKPAPPAKPADDEILGKAYDPHIVRRLLGYLRPYRRNLALALALMTVATAANVSGPYFVKIAFDNGIEAGNVGVLSQAVLGYLLAAGVLWVGTYLRVRIMAVTGQNVIFDLRRQMFDHLQALSLGFYSRYAVGRLVSRMVNDVSVLREMIVWAMLGVIRDFFDLAGITLAMLALHWQLSLLSFLVLPLMVIATEIFRRRARASYRQVRAAVGWVNAVLNENIVGVRVVQSFSREEHNFRVFAEDVNGNLLRTTNRAALIASVFFPTVDFIGSLSLGLAVWLGGLAVLGRFDASFGAGGPILTPGTLVAFALYIDRFFDPIRDLSQRYNTFQATMASSERIFELLDTPIDVADAPGAPALPPLTGRVEFRHVSFHYEKGGLPVLSDINLSVPPGQTVALVGETGAGKSSLVRLISRFYDVTAGAVLVDGHDVRAVTQDSLRRQMGVVLQDPFLFSGSVKDNIRYGALEATDEAIRAAAQAVGAHDFISALDQGYDTLVGEGGAILSGGQRQLISFARALLADPRILILDEATSSVDTQTERVIQTALQRLLRGRTAFVIAHRLSTITRADLILVMDHGRIIERGTHAQLLEARGRYFQLYTMAFAERPAPAA